MEFISAIERQALLKALQYAASMPAGEELGLDAKGLLELTEALKDDKLRLLMQPQEKLFTVQVQVQVQVLASDQVDAVQKVRELLSLGLEVQSGDDQIVEYSVGEVSTGPQISTDADVAACTVCDRTRGCRFCNG